jgi:hypothetical protein
LRTTVDGSIYVNDLDLTNMLYASFNAASGKNYIQGTLDNFSDGSTQVRCPDGHTVYYQEDQNPSLSGQTYALADLSGLSENGGELMPEPAVGTVFVIK